MANYQTPKMLQVEAEIAWFIELLQRENVTRFLEVGSKFGGSLWRIGCSLPKGSRIVAVDMPMSRETQGALELRVKQLTERGYDAHLILGDSTSPEVIEKVRELAPFAACLIDANHTLPYVTQDWINYGPMARMVAFHDIAWKRPPDWKGGYRIDVPQFWQSTKQDYRHEEVRLDKTGQDNGIGVLWREPMQR